MILSQGHQAAVSTNVADLENSCIEHMELHGIPFEGPLKMDGKPHRFSIDRNKGKKDEWYIANLWDFKGRLYLRCDYGSWSSPDAKYTFNSIDETSIYSFSKDEQKELKIKLREMEETANKERIERMEEAAKEAKEIWGNSLREPASEGHTAYLKKKGLRVEGHVVRFWKYYNVYDSLVIPLYSIHGEIRSLQFIYQDENGDIRKKFLSGGEKKGCFTVLGDLKKSDRFFVVEGFATGASIYEAVGTPVVIAFDGGNIDPVISALIKNFPKQKYKITICGDDDVDSPSNPGRKKAEEAAKKHGCNLLFPKFQKGWKLPDGKTPTDFNDLGLHFPGELKKQLGKRGRLNPIDINDLLQLNIPPKEIILSPWLREKDLGMIYASRGLGKTWFGLGVAYAIASGGRFLRYEALKARRVLYVDGEMALIVMKERLAKISAASEKKINDPSFLKIITYEREDDGIRDLGLKEGQEDINDCMDDFDVLILDNLSCLVRSGEENEATSWVSIQEWLLFLRKMGKTVLFIHHAGKNGTSRGTTKREDILDTVIALKKPKNHSPTDGARFEVHYEKNRGFGGKDANPFEAKLVTNLKGASEWAFKDVDGCSIEEAFELLKSGLSQADIAKELGVNRSTVSRWFKEKDSEE